MKCAKSKVISFFRNAATPYELHASETLINSSAVNVNLTGSAEVAGVNLCCSNRVKINNPKKNLSDMQRNKQAN